MTTKITNDEAYEELRKLAALLRARGGWKADNKEIKLLCNDLAKHLEGHNAGDVAFALKAHVNESNFFPSPAQLMAHIQPRIDWRLRHKERNRFKGNWKPDGIQRDEDPDYQQEPLEVRKAAVDKWRELRSQWAAEEARDERERSNRKRERTNAKKG